MKAFELEVAIIQSYIVFITFITFSLKADFYLYVYESL